MCGRYSIAAKADKVAKRFKVDVTDKYHPKYNAAPTQLLPVITSESPEGLSFFYWGMLPAWGKDKVVSPKLINARAETLTEKATFKTAFQRRRCLVIADGFYEWKLVGKKTKVPYRFVIDQREPFAFAGLWDEYENDEGEMIHTFTIVTTDANEVVSPIHDRMPAILLPDQEAKWLSKNTSESELLSILKPYPAQLMAFYSVSPLVNSVQNDSEELIKNVPPADQFGNYTLFG